VAIDLRGHGESGWATDGDYSHDAQADDLIAVAEALGPPPALVGASLGGLTSMWTVGQRRLAVSAVVLVDIVPRIEQEGASRIGAFMHSAPDGFASLDEAADAVARYLPHRPRPKNVNGLARNLRLGDDGRYRWHWDPNMFVKSPVDHDAIQLAAERMDAPTLLVRGRMSDIVSPEGVREFLERVPHAEFVDVADAHHMVSGDDNDAFSDAVIEFLDRVVRPTA
jgi:pimeloyl-ACP methyl ester carboxylesterase